MKDTRLRREITWHAARLMYERSESEYFRAKQKAARQLGLRWTHPRHLPSNSEIRDEIERMTRIHEGDSRLDRLQLMRVQALEMMRRMARFRPRIIGSVATGHVRAGSDIDIHLFSNSLESVLAELEYGGDTYRVERKKVRKAGEETIYRHVHVAGDFPVELTVYPESKIGYVFKSSITGKPIEGFSLAEWTAVMDQEISADDSAPYDLASPGVERFQLYLSLLLPLENVKQNPVYHPEGDALYHSLQVFDLAVDQQTFDEELLTAALLHDVGKAIDPYDHVRAGLEALESYITPRTSWLIEHHMIGHQIAEGTIGYRQHRRLQEHDSYPDLLLLSECDRRGRQTGVATSTPEDALEHLRDLAFEH